MHQNGSKNSECPILAILNFFLSFCTKLVGKNLECPTLPSLNFFQSFWGKLLEEICNTHFWPFQISSSIFGKNCQKKFGMAIFGLSEFLPVFFWKIVRRNSKHPFLAIPNLFQSFWQKLSEEIQNGHAFEPFWCKKTGINSKWQKLGILNIFKPFWCRKTGRNSEQPKLGILNFFQPVWYKKTGKNLEQPKLGIPNFFEPFWCKRCKVYI